MSKRRYEIAPLLLGLLATGALGVSALAYLATGVRPVARTSSGQPARSSGPTQWPIVDFASLSEMAPLDEVSLPAEMIETASLLEVTPLGIALPPIVSAGGVTDPLGATVTDRLAAAPLPLKQPVPVVILLPAEPRWRAGRSGRVVEPRSVAEVAQNVSQAERVWAVGLIETLWATHRVGRSLVVQAQSDAAIALTSRLAEMMRAFEDQAPAGVVEADLAGPVLGPSVTPDRVTPMVGPVAAPPQTIAAYLGERPSRGAFPTPEALATQLDRVAENRDLAPWAWDVAFRLRRLADSRLASPTVPGLLRSLETNAEEAFAVADLQADRAAGTELRRAAYAILRRTAAWAPERVETLAMLERHLSPAERLEEARWASRSDRHGPLPADRPNRLEMLRVAHRLEQYESSPEPRLARSLADAARRLAASGNGADARLATAIDRNYRNANVRFAIASDLVERMLPQPQPVTSPVRDRIAGSPVTGRSTTQTRLRLKLTPDDSHWRIGLEASGSVASHTYSRGGPAVLGSKGETSFVAEKQIVLSSTGLEELPTVADAHIESQRLVSLKTKYDGVPLLGRYVRSTVQDEYRRVRGRAAAETRVKVERRVSDELDQRVGPRLDEIETRFAKEVTDRFAKLGLRVDPVELRTTDTRLIGRVRVANHTQLAAHTPRMRAPSDSLLSVQLHESMLNNTLAGLELAGESLTTTQLRERLTDKLQLPAGDSAAADERAVLRFAEQDPIAFRLADGQAELTLSLAELRVRGRRHRDFKVHAFYRPEVNGLEASLVRVGAPHIEGRMRTAARIHLHGVMGKVLGEGERIPLIRPSDSGPDRLSAALVGLATNQFVIEDGWLGLAIGPKTAQTQVAERVGRYVR